METKEEKRHKRVAEKYKEIKTLAYYQTKIMTDTRIPLPKTLREAIDSIHPDVQERAIGVSQNQPECLDGLKVVELGCGFGRDSYCLSKLVKESGHVLAVDMLEDRIDFCKKYLSYHMKKFNFTKPNIDHRVSYVENIKECGVNDNSVDLITTNGVIVLCPDQSSVYKLAYDSLKIGGEMHFSEVFSNKPVSDKFDENSEYLAHGLATLPWDNFLDLALQTGFTHPRLYSVSKAIFPSEWKQDFGDHDFFAATYRMFKIPPGQSSSNVEVTYKGGITDYDVTWRMDYKTKFEALKPVRVDAELASILKSSRFSKYFTFKDTTEQAEIENPRCDPFKLIADDIEYFKM